MSWASFWKLHHKIGPELEKTERTNCPNGRITSDIRLSIALRYFAGASMWDIMISHGVSHSEAYSSIWAVVDVVNQEASFQISYPSSHAEQERIAAEFARKSECGFDNCAGCIDGMLVWMEKPTKSSCTEAGVDSAKFFCGQKHKYGLNMQAVCDARRRFIDVSIRN